VVLYEICSGRPLFTKNSANDTLVSFEDKASLCVWNTISDAMLDPVFQSVVESECKWKEGAKDLIRWCLKGRPEDRPTVKEILAHPFINPAKFFSGDSEASVPIPRDLPVQLAVEISCRAMKYHAFISHAQADASGTASTLHLAFKRLGVQTWLDVQQKDITLEGMKQGIRDSAVFILILTEHVLAQWFCQKEILTAIDEEKPFQIVLEEDSRFCPFDEATWRDKSGDRDSQGRVARFVKNVVGIKTWVPPRISDKIDELLDCADTPPVTYRRRGFEAEAMITELCSEARMGVSLPAKPNPTPKLDKPLVVYVIHNAEGQDMYNVLKHELQRGDIELCVDESRIAEADHVLLLLTAKILQQPSLGQLKAVLNQDTQQRCDRLTAIYSADTRKHGWEFYCEEHRACADSQVKQALDDHEALIFKKLDHEVGARNKHEFPAMLSHLLEQIVRRSEARTDALARYARDGSAESSASAAEGIPPSLGVGLDDTSANYEQLSAMKQGALIRHAQRMGIGIDTITQAMDDAEDSLDCKSAIIQIIRTNAVEKESAALREALAPMKLGALLKRAGELGIDHETIGQAMDDADDPKPAIIELIVKGEASSRHA
jgi:hypothetical protein